MNPNQLTDVLGESANVLLTGVVILLLIALLALRMRKPPEDKF